MFLTAESPTLEIDLSAEGHLYQLTIVGLWDGTTASLKIWSEILQDWMPLPSNWTADVNLPIRATSRKILLQLTGGTAPELGVQCLRLPLSQTPADAPGFYRNETTASFALSTADVGVYIRCLNAGAITIDVPTLVSEAIPLGSLIYFRRETDAGVITIDPGAGVTVHQAASAADVPPGGTFAMKKLTANEWDFI